MAWNFAYSPFLFGWASSFLPNFWQEITEYMQQQQKRANKKQAKKKTE